MSNPAYAFINYRRGITHLSSCKVLLRAAISSMKHTADPEVLRHMRIVGESIDDAKWEIEQQMNELKAQKED